MTADSTAAIASGVSLGGFDPATITSRRRQPAGFGRFDVALRLEEGEHNLGGTINETG